MAGAKSSLAHLFYLLLLLLPLLTSAKQKEKFDASSYADICGSNFPLLGSRGQKILEKLIKDVGRTSLKASTTAQHAAMCWVIHTDPKKTNAGSQMVQRYVLATIYSATQGTGWVKKDQWLSAKHECDWFGVTCNFSKQVTHFEMPFNNLVGLLPRDIKLLKQLQVLDLKANELQGVLPTGIGELKHLKVLKLNMNGFFGNIPKEIGELKQLTELNLYGNYFMGTLPSSIGKLTKLEYFDLYANNVGGTIPAEFGKMKSLREVYFNDNNFSGALSKQTTKKLPRLTELWADCRGSKPEIRCETCTVCCQDTANPKCERVATAKTAKAKVKK